MSKLECGYCFPSFELLDRIAEALDRHVSEFLSVEHLQNRSELEEKLFFKLKNSVLRIK